MRHQTSLLLSQVFLVTLSFNTASAHLDLTKAPGYLADGEVDLTALLPPPPKPHSKEQQFDIDAMLTIQKTRSLAQIERSTADAEVSVFRFSDVLGPSFSKAKLPKLSAFFDRVLNSTYSFITHSKDHWNRPRPFEASTALHPVKSVQEAVRMKGSPKYNPSYPSGHAMLGILWAILLSDMVPEKREALFKRGEEYGNNRTIALVHYPTDTEAGKMTASAVAFALRSHKDFREDFEKAKAELRNNL